MKKKPKPKSKPKAERPAGRMAQVSELKAGLSAYLARVKRGEEIVVTERGQPIARIVPLGRPEGAEWDRMRELERQGRVRLQGTGKISEEFWAMPRPQVPGSAAVDAVLAEREEGY